MVQCLQSTCLLDMFHRYRFRRHISPPHHPSASLPPTPRGGGGRRRIRLLSAAFALPFFLSLQIIEENGVQRVLVLPQQPDFRPGGHSPLHHPQPPPHAHLPAFIPHPAMMPLPPHLYTGMAGGVGDMSSQYTTQYHPAHIYSEQGESEPVASGLWCSVKKSLEKKSFIGHEEEFGCI